MNPKCLNCNLVNFSNEEICRRCGERLPEIARLQTTNEAPANNLGKKLDAGAIWFLKRLGMALIMSAILLIFSYLSMIYSAAPLSAEQQKQVDEAILILEQRGFRDEAAWLRWSVFRSNDNWFNALAGHSDAYAATNFPFQIVTLYEDFFTRAQDRTEQAVILLHETQHLKGAGEEKAYGFVWRNRYKLGWTRKIYGETRVFENVFKSTRQFAPEIFSCEFNKDYDCTE